ncbi:MAG: chromate transporter [Verrucomicrobia bacterium]|nr:chromate transporter [Verrucomicrobiota bacterium]
MNSPDTPSQAGDASRTAATVAGLLRMALKIGALGFGGPFALLAVLQKELVERRRWLPAAEFNECAGVGAIMPGPIFFATAVLAGHRLRGLAGAAACALGLLLPGFVLVVVIATLYVQVRQTPWVAAVSGGMAAGVVGLIASVVFNTGRSTVRAARDAALVAAALAALALLKSDPLVVIAAAALAGALWLRPGATKEIQ